MLEIDGKELIDRINTLGAIGIGEDGRRIRLAASDTEILSLAG